MPTSISSTALVWVGVDIPGNGSRYDYCVWTDQGEWFAAFPEFHAASRIGTGNYWTYIAEKMRVSEPDAKEMARIINVIQHAHGLDLDLGDNQET